MSLIEHVKVVVTNMCYFYKQYPTLAYSPQGIVLYVDKLKGKDLTKSNQG
jgi:hypothetical protein